MKIKSITVRNFKGCKEFHCDFSDKVTTFSGRNASGKTTTGIDAPLWLFFGKDSTWASKFNARTLNEDGSLVNNTEIFVEAVIEDNGGTEHTISKTQKQNWVTKRGTTDAELKGNLNIYMIDGFPKSEKEFSSFIQNIAPEEVFKVCSSVTYFMSLPWKDRRTMLNGMVTTITDYDLAVKFGGCDSILEDLQHGTTDDCQKKYATSAKGLKKAQVELPTRADEVRRSMSTIDTAPLFAESAEINEKLKALRSVKSDIPERLLESSSKISELYRKTYEIERKAEADVTKEIADLTLAVNAKTHEVSEATNKVEFYSRVKETSEKSKVRLMERFNVLQSKWDETKGLTFNENEAGKALCPTCGRTVTTKMVEKAKAEYNSKLAESKRAIQTEGIKIKSDIRDCDEQIKTAESEIARYEAIAKAANKDAKVLQKKLDKSPRRPDLSKNKELNELKSKISELEAEHKALEKEKPEDNTVEIHKLENRLREIQMQIAYADNSMKEKRIREIEEEQITVEDKLAHILRQQDELMQFVQKKMDYIGAEVNKRFKTVRFKLFDKQINGGIAEACEATINGVPYSDLNSGHRILAGLEIAKAFQDVYNFHCPVFIDNAESLSSENIPQVDGQLILLSVADCDLKVE